MRDRWVVWNRLKTRVDAELGMGSRITHVTGLIIHLGVDIGEALADTLDFAFKSGSDTCRDTTHILDTQVDRDTDQIPRVLTYVACSVILISCHRKIMPREALTVVGFDGKTAANVNSGSDATAMKVA